MSYGDLSDRVNQLLAGRASAKDRRDAFLVDELHIDPETLPITLRELQSRLQAELQAAGLASIRFIGNSMGLVRVETTEALDEEPEQCPQCGSYDLSHKTKKTWKCEDCDHTFKWGKEPAVTVAREAPKSATWARYVKWYETLTREVRTAIGPDGKPIEDAEEPTKPGTQARQFVITEPNDSPPPTPIAEPTPVCFEATADWGGTTITPIATKRPRWKRADKYPTGTILRVQDASGTLEYVRVGGLINDDDIVILGSMRTVDPGSWAVTEVLEQ